MQDGSESSGSVHTRAVVRGGALSLAGAIISAAMGFLFVLILGRGFGTEGSGIVLQAVALFTIALAVARAGLDTTAVWLLPRLREDQPDQLRPALVGMLLPSCVLACAVTFGILVASKGQNGEDAALTTAIATVTWFLPAATVMMVGLAATRGLGGVRPFVLVSSIAVPSARPLLVAVAATATAGTAWAGGAWAIPYIPAALATCWLLTRSLRSWEDQAQVRGQWWPDRKLWIRIRNYSLPRSIATLLEQAMLWIDVLLVGLVAGPGAAGVYGAATRFVAAGRILSTAFRIVVAPTYSRLLGQHRIHEVQSLYTKTTQWIVLFSTPVFVLYALFGGTILTALGTEFRTGASALAVLSLGLTIGLLGGNIQVLLLMGGHSGRTAVNKALTLIALVSGILILTPEFGILGAATAWAISMTIDFALAAWQVHKREHVRAGGRAVFFALLVGAGVPGIPALGARIILGDTLAGLLTATLVGALTFLCATFILRRSFALTEIATVIRRRET